MIFYLILIISLLLDGILTNYLPYLVNDLSYFTPSLTLISIIIIYPYFVKKQKNYFITIFLLGFIYDLFYTNLYFYHAVIFFLIGYLLLKVDKFLPRNMINFMFIIIGTIIFYEGLTGILLYIFHIVPVTITKVLYKITHSILINVIYGEIIYGLLKILPKKYTKISIH